MRLQVFVVYCILQSIHGFPNNAEDVLTRFGPSGVLYIVGGEEAGEDQATFQCSLQSYGEHFCGCAVINSKFVVTASHCVNSSLPEEVNVMVGSNNLKCGGRYYQVERLIPHELYNTPKGSNDIALVKVKGSIEFGENVKPIELEDKELLGGTEVGLTGWGRLQAEGDTPQKLQYLRLFVLPMDICKKLEKSLLSFTTAIFAPVAQWEKEHAKCGVGKPDVFAKVSYFVDWIMKHITI